MVESLKNKTIKGTMWSAIDNVVQYAVSFVVSIILARLLSPDDYGLVGLTTVFTAICTALINGGFTTALIRKKDITEDDFSTSFIVNMAVSFVLYLVIFVCARLIANFFEREELVGLIRVSSLGMIIGALALVQQTRLTKAIDFKTQTKITLIASIASGAIGITMALLGCGVWSLVIQTLSSQAFRTVFLWIYNKWAPKLRFSSESFRNLFGFGWKMMLSSLLDTLWRELNQVIVGKFYSPATLGQYSRGKSFSQLFSSNLTTVIQRVTYPVLSEIQDDNERMIHAYRRVIKMTMFVTVVFMFTLGAIAEPLLFCLIGSKWAEAAKYLPWICVAGTLYPLHALNLNMLQVQGRSDLFLFLEIIKKIIGLAPLFVGVFVGIMQMLYCGLIIGVISYFLNSYFPGKLLGYSSWKQIKDIAPSYGIATLVAFVVWPMKFLPLSYWIVLPLQIIAGIFVFFLITRICHFAEYDELKLIIKQYIRHFSTKK